MTLDSDNIRFMRIFAGGSLERGVRQQWGNQKRTSPTYMLSVPQRYRRTDRQTDGRTTYDSNTALALRASRGKNTYQGLGSTRASIRVRNFSSTKDPQSVRGKQTPQ